MNQERKESTNTSVDWNEIRSHLDATRKALEQGFVPSLDDRKRILRTRAQALAREPLEQKKNEEQIECIAFELGYENYAIEADCVHGVYPLKDLTPVPCTPPFILGVMNVHGKVLSVIDIQRFFELPERGLTDLNKVIVVGNAENEFGILADTVIGMTSIALNQIAPAPATFTGIRLEYLKGITAGPVAILNIRVILSDPNVVVHEEADR